MQRKILGLLLLVLMFLMGASTVRAYNRYGQNPAELNLMESVFVNPALNPWLRDKFSITGTFYHPALTGDLTAVHGGMLGYHFPWKARGLGAGVQYLKSGLYRETQFRMSYGYPLLRQLSIGANFDTFMLDYDQLEFYRFDYRDPVIQNSDFVFNWSAGLGIFARPFPNLQIAATWEDINRPKISAGGKDFKELWHYSVGAVYRINEWWALRMTAFNLANNALSSEGQTSEWTEIADHVEFGVSRTLSPGAVLRLNGGQRSVWSELEFHMLDNWYFNYRYDYPLTEINLLSDGTHRFGLVYDVYRRPPLPVPQDLPAIPLNDPRGQEWPIQDPRGQIYLYTPDDELNIRHIHTAASVDDQLGEIERMNLRPRDFGDERQISVRTTADIPLADRVLNRPPDGMYTPEYLGALESMGHFLKSDFVNAELITPQRTVLRAKGLERVVTGGGYQIQRDIPIRNEFTNELGISTIDSLMGTGPVFIEDRFVGEVPFYIVKAFSNDFSAPWRFTIRDLGLNEIILDVGSPTSMPDEIVWAGRDGSGNLLPPGIYEYLFTYDRADNVTMLGGHGRMRVVHHEVHRNIDIREKLSGGERLATDFELILNPESRRRLAAEENNE
jgi:Type IX secretion system membrane protein PorP/SprF